jgi:hypothetical protein
MVHASLVLLIAQLTQDVPNGIGKMGFVLNAQIIGILLMEFVHQ